MKFCLFLICFAWFPTEAFSAPYPKGGLYGGQTRKDVTDIPKWWGKLHRGIILEIKGDMVAVPSTKEAMEMATSTAEKGWKAEISVDEIRRQKQLHYLIVPKGTRLRCTNLYRADYYSIRWYEIACTIVSGRREGDKVHTIYLAGGDFDRPGTLEVNPIWAKIPSQRLSK